MNWLNNLTNTMTGGQPTQQEAEYAKMAQEYAKKLELQKFLEQQMQQQSLQQYVPAQGMQATPQASPQASPYMQGLTNPGMTIQQNYIDPRLIEQMYYKGLLSR